MELVPLNDDAADDTTAFGEDYYFDLEAINAALVAAFASEKGTAGDMEIHVRVSHNDGASWQPQVRVSGGSIYLDQFPVITGDPATGRITGAFYLKVQLAWTQVPSVNIIYPLLFF